VRNKETFGRCLFFSLIFLLGLGSTTVGFAVKETLTGPPPAFPEKPDAGLLGTEELTAHISLTSEAVSSAYLPIIVSPPAVSLWIDTQSRTAVQQYYLTEYLASEGVAAGWTGNHGNCQPGTTTLVFREAVLRRINYFRAMAGIAPVTGFNETYNSKAQAAALMMSVNGSLSHSPPTSWLCYTDDGHSGAGSSNLYLGIYGPSAISGYIRDPGASNYFVGHRRWILYPQTQYMGTGDIPPEGGYAAANALWVFDTANMWEPRPPTREAYIAWPPPGYVPYQVVFPRWSFAYDDADLSNATVTITRDGQPIGITLSPVVNGYGENTLVWELDAAIPQPPGNDMAFNVTIRNVSINGSLQEFSYEVTVFDPNT